MAPILPFTAEEVHHSMHQGRAPETHSESVHMELFPPYTAEHDRLDLIAEWDRLIEIREVVSKALEEVRQAGTIGDSLEARLTIRAGGEALQLLRRHEPDLRYIFIVSQVELVDDLQNTAVQVQVHRANGGKCERCWNYSLSVGTDSEFTTLCERCVPVVREMAKMPVDIPGGGI
jgi:isoleucyl-tRNA synthetase